MSAIDDTPENKNFLSPLNYKFTIKKAPHVNFFVQEATVPDLTLPSPNFPNPMVNIPLIGDHLTYGDFDITFKLDEDLQNYLEIHNWIRALGKPVDFVDRKKIREIPVWTGDGEKSDLSLIILTSNKTPNFEFVMVDAWPVYISPIKLLTTAPTVNYITATARFKYTYFNVDRI